MYCFITTCAVECYWHCSDETVHYKSDETVNFCGFRCATIAYNRFYKLCFLYIITVLNVFLFNRNYATATTAAQIELSSGDE